MKNKAFTLVETLIAITLITVVLTAVTGLILSTLLSNQRNLHSLQGLYLAQEGLEAMRFMRDSNWLQNYSWNGGASLWGGDFDLSGGSTLELYLKEDSCPPCFSFTSDEEEAILTSENGVEFLRTLTVQSLADENDATQARSDTVEVISTVSWQDRGIERAVSLSTYLTNWQ